MTARIGEVEEEKNTQNDDETNSKQCILYTRQSVGAALRQSVFKLLVRYRNQQQTVNTQHVSAAVFTQTIQPHNRAAELQFVWVYLEHVCDSSSMVGCRFVCENK